MDVKLCRVITGETIIGQLEGENIIKCCLIRIVPGQDGNVQTIITPYFAPISNEFVTIDEANLVVTTDPVKELTDKYREIVSGISIVQPGGMPSNMGIIPGQR